MIETLPDFVPEARRMARLTVRLPVPPSINQQYVQAGRRRILTPMARAYKCDMPLLIRHAMAGHPTPAPYWPPATDTAHYALTLHFFFQDLYRRDVDNGVKILQDVITATLGINDNRLMEVHATKAKSHGTPHVQCWLDCLHL